MLMNKKWLRAVTFFVYVGLTAVLPQNNLIMNNFTDKLVKIIIKIILRYILVVTFFIN